MNPLEKTFVLNRAACDEIAELIADFCQNLKLERKDTLRYRLAAEECLLFWLDHDCAGKQVQLRMGRKLLATYISLELEGEPLDPYRDETGNFGPFCSSIMQNLHLTPEYSYEHGRNHIYLRVQRKRPSQLDILRAR